jgi:pyridoxine/pyridoxamine 5'-phosphate oxidase
MTGDTTGFWIARGRSTLTQVNSFSRQLWQPAAGTSMKLDDMRVHYDRNQRRQSALRVNPFEQFATWMHEACETNHQLHDRLLFTRLEDGTWQIERAP